MLTELLALLRPSKMLLTTRRYPDVGSLVYVHRMGLLSETDALQLLRHQAAAGGIAELLHAGAEDLRQIYATVGGHPLALSLAARLCRLFPFQTLLAGWQGQPTGLFADTYQQIYEPLWGALTAAQQLMLLGPVPGRVQWFRHRAPGAVTGSGAGPALARSGRPSGAVSGRAAR